MAAQLKIDFDRILAAIVNGATSYDNAATEIVKYIDETPEAMALLDACAGTGEAPADCQWPNFHDLANFAHTRGASSISVPLVSRTLEDLFPAVQFRTIAASRAKAADVIQPMADPAAPSSPTAARAPPHRAYIELPSRAAIGSLADGAATSASAPRESGSTAAISGQLPEGHDYMVIDDDDEVEVLPKDTRGRKPRVPAEGTAMDTTEPVRPKPKPRPRAKSTARASKGKERQAPTPTPASGHWIISPRLPRPIGVECSPPNAFYPLVEYRDHMLQTKAAPKQAIDAQMDMHVKLIANMPERVDENMANFQRNHDLYRRMSARSCLAQVQVRCTDFWRIIVVNTWGVRNDSGAVMSIIRTILRAPFTTDEFRFICEDDVLYLAMPVVLQELFQVLINLLDADTWVKRNILPITPKAYAEEFVKKSRVLWRGFDDILPMHSPIFADPYWLLPSSDGASTAANLTSARQIADALAALLQVTGRVGEDTPA